MKFRITSLPLHSSTVPIYLSVTRNCWESWQTGRYNKVEYILEFMLVPLYPDSDWKQRLWATTNSGFRFRQLIAFTDNTLHSAGQSPSLFCPSVLTILLHLSGKSLVVYWLCGGRTVRSVSFINLETMKCSCRGQYCLVKSNQVEIFDWPVNRSSGLWLQHWVDVKEQVYLLSGIRLAVVRLSDRLAVELFLMVQGSRLHHLIQTSAFGWHNIKQIWIDRQILRKFKSWTLIFG